MALNVLDYFLIAIVAVGFPVWSLLDYRRFLKELAQGVPDARVHQYRLTIAVEWIATAAIFAGWLARGRGLAAFGLGFENSTRFWVGTGLALAATVVLIVQAVMVTGSRKRLVEMQEHIGDLQSMFPRGAREANWWRVLSFTAGICEEIIFRGFLIAVLAVPFGIWPAVLLSTVVFGLIHAYQDPKGIVRTGVVGLIMAGLFLLTGSLWASILLHVVIDLTSGHMLQRAIESRPDKAPVTA